MLEIDYILYSRKDRYDMKRVVDDMRDRTKKSWEIMPDSSDLWMTVGLQNDEEGARARSKYLEMYPRWWNFSDPSRPVIYPYKGTDNPNFGKFPPWTDPWGRIVRGGENGANALDPLVDLYQWAGGGTVTAGAGPAVLPFMLEKPPKGSYEIPYGREGDALPDYPG
jgi:hypothetical protein